MASRTKIPSPKTIEAAREWIRDAMPDGWGVMVTAEFHDSRKGCSSHHRAEFSATFIPPKYETSREWLSVDKCRTPAELVKRFVAQTLPKILRWRECFGDGDDEPIDDDGVVDATAIVVSQRRPSPRQSPVRLSGRQQAKLPAPRQPLLEDRR